MFKDTMEPPHVDAANSEIISTTLFKSDEINEPGRVSACTINSRDEPPRCNPTEPTGPELIIGFDAEWVNGARAEDSLPSNTNILLSYQMVVLNPRTSEQYGVIVYPAHKTKRGRLALVTLITQALTEAKKKGVIDKFPETVAVVGFFLRADLATLKDWPSLKSKVDSVRNTFASTSRPLVKIVRRRKMAITFVDAMLLSPQGSSLKTVGKSIGVEKIELPPGQIERMDLLLRGDPKLFERYALQDAVIAARYLQQISDVLPTKLGVGKPVPTLGAAGVLLIRKAVENLGISSDNYFGYVRHRHAKHYLPSLTEAWPFASNCYHGGRNEAFYLGYTPIGTKLYDVDLTSAYTTAMAMIKVPDWESAKQEHDIAKLAVVGDAMTIARVEFSFPIETRYPSLPVRAGARGLVYPLNGTSWCTGPELVVALSQGARIVVEAGWRVEWVEGSSSPFESFTRTINKVRKDAKARGDVLLDKLAKEIGNSGYGKVAQAVDTTRTATDGGVGAQRGKRVFDSRSGEMKTLPPSLITNPMMAAMTTGLVRAAVSEALARLPVDAVVCSVTTDGFLSSVPVEAVDNSGPVAKAFIEARTRITPDNPIIWEEKHRIGRALITKTRGAITIEPFDVDDPGTPVLARAGFKLNDKPDDPWEECAQWDKACVEREYDTRLTSKSLTPLRTQWVKDADLVEVQRQVRLNMDFDLKREPVDPTDVEGVITAKTRPWSTIEEFDDHRDALENWKKSQRRVLKTVADLRDLQDWNATRPGQRASGSTTQSGRPSLVNAFLKAVTRGELDLGQWPYKRIADFLTACGWPVSVDTVKQAKKRGKLTLGAICVLSADDLCFARVVYHECPDCRLELLVAEGSAAAKALVDARTAVQRQPVVNDESATAASIQTPMVRMGGDAEGDIEGDAFPPPYRRKRHLVQTINAASFAIY